MEHMPPFALFCCACLGLWITLTVAHSALALLTRTLDAIVKSARATGEAAGVAAAWPVEMGADLLERWAAQGVEWREQRRIWRAEFKASLSWNDFQRQMNGSTKPRDEVADALDLMALKVPFKRADLDTRFRLLMAAVHPDKGGSAYLARQVDEARALILKSKGWRR